MSSFVGAPVLKEDWERLFEAVEKEDLQSIETLAAPETLLMSNGHSMTPLGWAVKHSKARSVKALLSCGADPNSKAHWVGGASPLAVASKMGAFDCVAALVDAGADIEAGDARGRTPLLLASLALKAATVELLLDGGASREAVDSDGRGALELSVLGEKFTSSFNSSAKGASQAVFAAFDRSALSSELGAAVPERANRCETERRL